MSMLVFLFVFDKILFLREIVKESFREDLFKTPGDFGQVLGRSEQQLSDLRKAESHELGA